MTSTSTPESTINDLPPVRELILGVGSPVLRGFLAFLINYVPNLGAVIAAIPAVLLALVQLGMGRATLADANAERDYRVFKATFYLF